MSANRLSRVEYMKMMYEDYNKGFIGSEATEVVLKTILLTSTLGFKGYVKPSVRWSGEKWIITRV